ncbi:hypothetical protein SUGI_1199280 [Cryptomeria japonica]|uniref:uncharacterized protein LOC131038129 n=1 Tax=Cryptomeria japonica TaxID=3369 RepID=UPI00241470A5|nr:uncharacterized protein LOC131038129 [Cryptomeria japonica]GLJ55852.1 hypothetical protein SUGI_1199280 [Cryptomeria japonica]
MLARNILTEEETRVDPELGYPRGYAKLCRNAHLHMQGLITPYTEGPPQRFLPYALQPEDIAKVKEFNELFPIIESEERDPSSARRFADSLWQQLDHLGNAGFDPAMFRIDPYGNVLYKNADPASPLAWEVDHWFPHSRGGKTVISNLRLVQWQVNQRKQNKLEFLVPWWDLQLGVSVNQFLLIFLSKNSDFRQRAFSLLFFAGENEPFTELLVADCHSWPQHFRERKSQIGLAPAAIVRIHKQTNDTLKPQNGTPGRRRWTVEEEDALRQAVRRFGPGNWKEIKENEPLFRNRSTVQIKDKYRLVKEDWELEKENKRGYLSGKELILSTAIQKESRLKKLREDEIQRKAEEISELNKELKELQQQNEAEGLVLEDLESILIKHRRRLEKQRRWSEAQSSYRICLENMIRDTMHQSIVYKEQGRLNQAACNALMARLETQKAACDASEMDLLKRLKLREDLERLLPHSEQVGIKLHEDGTANCPPKDISLRLEESQTCLHLDTQCSDSVIIAAEGMKEDSDKYGTTETSLPHFESKEECPKILQDLRLSPEEKQLEDKSNMSLTTQKDQYKTDMDTPKVEVLPTISLRNPAMTGATKEKQRLSEAEQSDLDVLFVGYEYEGTKARGREEESVGENMTFVTSSEFKHSNFEGWSKGDCASRIGENDDLNKHYMLAEEDRECKPVEDSKLDAMLDDGLEMQGQTKTAIPDAVAEKGKEEDEAIIMNGKSNVDKWLQMLLLNPQSKENLQTENNNLPQIQSNSNATQVCETNNILEGQTMNLRFREQPPINRKTPISGGSEKKEYEIHQNPRLASASGLMVTGTSQLSCSENQVNESLDLIEKFKFLQLDCDDQKKPRSNLDNAPSAGLELPLQGNGKSNIENSTAFVQPLAVRDSEGAILDSGTEVQYEKMKHNNFNQLKDVQIGTEMPLKDNPGYTSEIREPEGMITRSDDNENSMNFKGQESRLKRSESIGYLSNAYSTTSLGGTQCKEGQSKGRNEEEGKFKAAKFTEEDGQQGLALLKNGLTASIKTCTHMWKKAVKRLEGTAVGTGQNRSD